MKFEKLTENKIRIILKKGDFKDKTLNITELSLNSPESQKLFLEILNKAEKEINFDTTGHKLLIEVATEAEDTFIFTITKYLEKNITEESKHKKILKIKKSTSIFNSSTLIYQFNTFEDFCVFCDFIHNTHYINTKKLFKSAILYLFNSSYYLIIDGINLCNHYLITFHSTLLEFSNLAKYNKNFKFKLKEHGKVIIKNNAINTGIKYFC